MSEDQRMGLTTGEAVRDAAPAAAPRANTAGALLRQARQAKGLHIAALAASLKVPQRKLEALENDRYAELPDATFARALAQTMCRALKVDPAPVLALLPLSVDPELDRVARGLNQPFRDRPGRDEPNSWAWLQRPGPLVAIVLLLAAVGVYLAPSGLWTGGGQATPAAAAASEAVFPPVTDAPQGKPAEGLAEAPAAQGAASAPAPAAVTAPAPTVSLVPAPVTPVIVAPTTPAPTPATTQAAAPSPAPVAATPSGTGPLLVRATAETWVEVQDANGRMLLNRTMQVGEQLALDGAMPLKLKIGNVVGTAVQFRGQPVDLGPRSKDNVARFELK